MKVSLVGDLNASVGNKGVEIKFGAFGIGNNNENKENLIEICGEREIVLQFRFKKGDIHLVYLDMRDIERKSSVRLCVHVIEKGR